MSNWEQSFKDYLLFESIMEIFDGSGEKFDYRGPFGIANKGNSKVYLFDYTTADGEEREMRAEFFATNLPEVYEVAFRHTDPRGESPYEEVSGAKKIIPLLNTITNIIEDFYKRNPDIKALVYQAEDSRLNLYAPMFKGIEKKGEIFPGWESGTHFKIGPRHVHYIKEKGYDLSTIDQTTLL